MAQNETTAVAPTKKRGTSADGGFGNSPRPRQKSGGWLMQYKQDQGKNTRVGTFIGLALLIVWGAWVLYDYLKIYEGDEFWRLLITRGIPIAFSIVLGSLAWWVAFANRASGDFMIATEGEMKKVSWSTKREVIGSTKVVILFTILFAALLFVVDLAFQTAFKWIGVLKI